MTEKAEGELPSHYSLKQGELDPELNKTVEEVVYCCETFVVYVATDLSVQWRTAGEFKEAEHFGDVLNLVSALECQSDFIEEKKVLKGIRRRIAEGLARCFSAHNKESSFSVLMNVEKDIQSRNKETSWRWYFAASYQVTLFLATLSAFMWLFRSNFREFLGTEAFDIVLGTLFGSFGALLSVTSRSNSLVLDANAGKTLHKFEGLSRIGAGLIGALLVGLAVKSGLILGGIHFVGSKLALLLTLSIIAGASERLIPSLIETLSKNVTNPQHKDHLADAKSARNEEAVPQEC